MADIPSWKEISGSDKWATLAPEKQNSVRERWINDVSGKEPDWTPEQRESLRAAVYEGAQTQPPQQLETPTLETPALEAPTQEQIAPQIGPQIGPQVEPQIGPQVEPQLAPQIEPQLGEHEGPAEIFTPVGKLIESLFPATAQKLGPIRPSEIAGTADHLFSVISTPLSFAMGGLKAYNKPFKDDPGGFKSAFRAAWDNISQGKITDASAVRKELKGKTFEEANGVVLGTLANIGLSILADPLIVPTLTTKVIIGIKNIAKGRMGPGEAVKLLASSTDDKVIKDILKGVEKESVNFRIVRKKLPAKMPSKELKALPKRAALLPPKEKIALQPRKAIPLPGKRIALPAKVSTTRKPPIALKAPAKPKTGQLPKSEVELRKIVEEAGGDYVGIQDWGGHAENQVLYNIPEANNTTVNINISKVTVENVKKATAAKIKLFESKELKPPISIKPSKAGITPKTKSTGVLKDTETVEDFISRGGKVEEIPAVSASNKQFVGAKSIKKAKDQSIADLGETVSTRKGLKDPGGVKEGIENIHLLDDADDGEFLGSISGGAQKFYERRASMAERGEPTAAQMKLKTSWLSVEKPWQNMNKPDTGFAVKNIYSRMESIEIQAKETMKSLAKTGKTGFRTLLKPLTPKSKKGFSQQELSDIVYYAEDKKLFDSADEATKKRLTPGIKILRNFFDNAQKKYRELGANPDFKTNTIKYYQENNIAIKDMLDKINTGSIKRVTQIDLKKMGISIGKDVKYKPKNMAQVKNILKGEAKVNSEIAKRLDDIEFVHIPYAMWFDDAMVDKAAMVKSLKLANLRKRKTIAIRDLVESGVIKDKAVNPFDIISSYSRRMAKDFAMLDIKKAATAEGMISSKKIEGFERVDHRRFPLFAGKYVHPAFNNWLYGFKAETVNANRIDRVFSKVKMWQFIKPLFLPYYDLYQHVALKNIGLINPIGTGKDIYKAIKNVTRRTPEYFEALDNGIASKPFDLPWQTQAEFVDKMKSTNFGSWIWKAAKQNKTLIKPIYEALWNTAWFGDEVIRFMSYNYLKRKGLGNHESAQLAALFHSDYASVPVATRRALNKLFFTPTFKITMFKLYKEMFKAAAKVPAKTIMGKYKDLTPQDKILARGGAATVFGLMIGFDQLMTKGLGYQRDQFARRYYKPVTIDGQERESVQVFANPMTLIPKYMAKAEAFANDFYSDTALEGLYKAVKWELHPVYRISVELTTNKGNDGEMIVNPISDSEGTKWGKRIAYAARQSLKIIENIGSSSKEKRDQAYNFFKKDVGILTGALVSPTLFSYLRAPSVVRERAKLRKLSQEYNNTIYNLKRAGKYDRKAAMKMNISLVTKTKEINRLIKEAERKNDLYYIRQGRKSNKLEKNNKLNRP